MTSRIKILALSMLLCGTSLANSENAPAPVSASVAMPSDNFTPKPLILASIEKTQNTEVPFLAENKKRPGVLTLPSGLQYQIVQKGSGKSPGPTDFVTVNYRGTLIDGTEFDSSYSHQGPATFAVNAVIPGWSEALQMMQIGDKWTIYVPSSLAYGAQGAGKLIKPNTPLIFDIELLGVKQPLDATDEDGFNDFEDED